MVRRAREDARSEALLEQNLRCPRHQRAHQRRAPVLGSLPAAAPAVQWACDWASVTGPLKLRRRTSKRGEHCEITAHGKVQQNPLQAANTALPWCLRVRHCGRDPQPPALDPRKRCVELVATTPATDGAFCSVYYDKGCCANNCQMCTRRLQPPQLTGRELASRRLLQIVQQWQRRQARHDALLIHITLPARTTPTALPVSTISLCLHTAHHWSPSRVAPASR